MSYCTSVTNNDKLFIQPFELCSLVALDNLKTKLKDNKFNYDSNTIFNEKFKTSFTDINSNLRNDNNNFIYEYDKNKKDLCYQINNKNEWNVNCAIKYLSPLYTYDNKTQSCTLIPNIRLPEGFIYNKEKGQNYIYFDINENNNPDYPLYKFQKRKAFCENKWFDWIVVPNYHFGNNYERDSGIYSKRDVRKCYKPCGKGMFPYVTNENEKICIPKSEAYDGIYTKKLDYSPLALINLIGNSNETLKELYNMMRIEKKINYDKNQLSIIEEEEIRNIDIDDEINNNCIPSIVLTLLTNIVNKETIDIENIENNTSIISYKNPYFNEDEEELYTLRGMANANIMTDIILVHTFLLAYKYNKFITEYIKKVDNYNDFTNNIIQNKFNIKKVLLEKFKKIQEDKNEELNDIKGFNELKNIYKTEIENNSYYNKYIQRLANILYKAINICYNNETNFSKNLIIYTKKAYNNIYTNINNNKAIYINSNESIYNDLDPNINFIIKIPFIDIKDGDNTPIKDYLNITTDNTIYNKFYEFLHSNITTLEVFFYTQEHIEKKKLCKANEIPNPDKNSINKCLKCNDICNTKEKCIDNKNCEIYCENEYYQYVTKDNNNNNSNKNNTKCGVIKKSNESVTKSNGKKIYETPIDEGMKLPNFSNLLNIFIKIIFILLTIYIIYIFYQIYGETIFTLINWFIYYSGYFILRIYYGSVTIYNYCFGLTNNTFKFNKIISDYVRSNATNNYKKVTTTVNNLLAEMRK